MATARDTAATHPTRTLEPHVPTVATSRTSLPTFPPPRSVQRVFRVCGTLRIDDPDVYVHDHEPKPPHPQPATVVG